MTGTEPQPTRDAGVSTEGVASRLPTLIGYAFTAVGGAMLVGGVILVFDDPAGFVLVAFGLVFMGAGHLARRLFATPEGKRPVYVSAYEADIEKTDGRRGTRRQASIIHVDADATEEEIQAAKAAWRREQWERRPDWVAGRIASENERSGGVLHLAAGLWSAFALGATVAALYWEGIAQSVAIAAALMAGALIVRAVRRALRLRKFGNSYLVLAQNPAFLGGVIDGEVESGVPGDVALSRGFHVQLRCVHRWEESSHHGSSRNRPTHYHRDVLWEEEKRTAGRATADDGDLSVPVRFRLPADQPPSTPPASGEGIFWEVELAAEVEGLDYHAVFKIPVFREGAAAWNEAT